MSAEKVTIEAALRVINAALEIVSEEQRGAEELRASIRHNMQAAQAWSAPPDWEAQHQKILDLLELCDERERQADEHEVSRDDAAIAVSAIRRILTT